MIKPVATPERPTGRLGLFAIFGSSLGLMIVLVLYGANIFAAYHVAIYRRQPVSTVCGLAAVPFFGVLSPIIFIAMPPKAPPAEIAVGRALRRRRRRSSGAGAFGRRPAGLPRRRAALQSPCQASRPRPRWKPRRPAAPLPEAIVFVRGEYTFNRRFFETKFPGFFRAIRAEAEKDLVLLLKTSRGDFVGRRITRITPNELYLQIFSNNVTADEMIPFIEVMEVQIRHKDAA